MLLDVWEASSAEPTKSIVLPDGCRDLIYTDTNGERPTWHVSPLFDAATVIETRASTLMRGYRLRPGTHIDEGALLEHLGRSAPGGIDITALIEEHVTEDAFTSDALQALSQTGVSMSSLARDFRISERTLQRRIRTATGRSPGYWAQLARVRRAARQLLVSRDITDVAYTCGYADQAHMTRAFRKWFGAAPKQFTKRDDLARLARDIGYDGADTGEQISTRKPSGSVT